MAVAAVPELIRDRSKPNPDVIRKYHAATLPEAVDGVRALQEQGSFIDCVGVMAQEYVLSEVNRRVKEQIAPGLRKVEIVPAKLANTAGMMGAVSLAEKLLA